MPVHYRESLGVKGLPDPCFQAQVPARLEGGGGDAAAPSPPPTLQAQPSHRPPADRTGRGAVALSLRPPGAPTHSPPVWAELGGQHLQGGGGRDTPPQERTDTFNSPAALASTFSLPSHKSRGGPGKGGKGGRARTGRKGRSPFRSPLTLVLEPRAAGGCPLRSLPTF